ncbi:MAG TPA: response regulator [Opitutaceae bacterium]|nr:response regulator [Opitutaceae bacterium]
MSDATSASHFRVLVIDDTAAIHDDFRKILHPEMTAPPRLRAALSAVLGPRENAASRKIFEVDCALQGQEGLALLRQARAEQRPYALAFVDMRIPPGWDGIETIRHLWAEDPALQTVICTAYSDYSWNQTVQALGDTDNLVILKKPFDNIEVLQLAHALTQKWAATRAAEARMADLDEAVRQRTAELRSSEERFILAFQASPMPSALQNLGDSSFLDLNIAFIQLSGHPRENLLYRSPAELGLWVSPEAWTEVLNELRAHHPVREHRLQLRPRTGAPREILLSAQPLRIGTQACALTVLQDVTDQLRLEGQLRQAQKMEAIGQLAAGIAHDFNNLLTVILGYTADAVREATLPPALRDNLGQVRSAAERAAALTRQLLVFSHQQASQMQPLEVDAVLFGLREMLGRLIGENIEIAWDCPKGLPRILADNADLEQVVMNLMVNARDALPQGGRIYVRLRSVQLDADGARRHPEARPGRYVSLAVSDNGCGMTAAVMERLFDPFFTTKSVGKGTGLGLSTAYAIVHQLHGWIEVESTVGHGSIFTLFLPALEEEAAASALGTPAVVATAGAVHRGHERVLLVEDDPFIRSMLTRFLQREGYRLTAAMDGPSALEAWTAAQGQFDLLITDMVMPNGLSGAQLAERLRIHNPQLKAILISGYSQELLDANAEQLKSIRMLMKPFTHEKITETIREVLDASATG